MPIPLLPLEVDIGVIELWSGAIIDIPEGWVLCDGTQGTPDLRDLFTVGAGGIFNPDETGGDLTHNHILIGDGHDHILSEGPALQSGNDFASTTDQTSITGMTDQANTEPPFYALAYVMFIGH